MNLKKISGLLILLLALPLAMMAQVTTSSINGVIKNLKGENLQGATITAVHVPTGTVYTTTTQKSGTYYLNNLNPGGPYKITVSYVGLVGGEKTITSLNLGDAYVQNFELSENASNLTEVVVTGARSALNQGKGGTETSIGRDKIQNLPSVGRNISDYLKYVPQAKVTGDGAISIAGQNNRYNSFYIDGAVNNDVFGLAASGTNGGQTGIAPISIDAIDQLQVVLAPYDASLGNFTGGGINAITKSGTNELHASVYHLFRNQDLSGKTPFGDKSKAVKLPDFTAKTTGATIGGAIIKNKLFFFLSGEIQRDDKPQPTDVSGYLGNSGLAGIQTLSDFLKSSYKYDAGGYTSNPNNLKANRVATKVDWNVNSKNKLTASYRYNYGISNNASRSTNSTINFGNNGIAFPSTTNSGSLELNSKFRSSSNNKLLLTFTNVNDNRNPIGDPFPRVTIRDGAANIVFGSEEFSTGNILKQNNAAIFDVFKFYKGKHAFSVGTDNEFSKSTNVFIRQNFGSYQYDSLSGFLNGLKARQYDRTYSLLDPKGTPGDLSNNAAAKFNTVRLGFFVGDEIKATNNLTLTLGVRADYTKFITTPKTDKFFNDTAISILSKYYDLKGARSGQINSPKVSINPRIGFTYRIPDEGVVIRGGLGTFTGRVPLVWPGGVYNNNGISLAGVRGIGATAVVFRPDPFGQYDASELGVSVPAPSGQVDLIAKDFRLNKVFRTSLGFDKKLSNKWKVSVEGIFTKNINEIDYKRIDLLPATLKSNSPDVRDIYTTGTTIPQISLRSTGTAANKAPYSGIYLLSNNDQAKGFSYNFTFTVDKAWDDNWSFNANYNFGNSIVKNEGTSSQNNSQWRFMEAINGRNNIGLSTSDYDYGSRISSFLSKKFKYLNDHAATTLTLVYNGQSGNPFSYTTQGSLIRDNSSNDGNDLLYIPTASQLQSYTFLTNTVGSGTSAVVYTPQQQKDNFESYIQTHEYLNNRRGQYAERNGARLPFTHDIDFKFQQDFSLKMAGKKYKLQLTYDIFNLTNLLNRKWGTQYFISNDQSTILSFQGYVSPTNLTPQYKFTPRTNNNPYVVSDGASLYNSSRWNSQIGVRLTF